MSPAKPIDKKQLCNAAAQFGNGLAGLYCSVAQRYDVSSIKLCMCSALLALAELESRLHGVEGQDGERNVLGLAVQCAGHVEDMISCLVLAPLWDVEAQHAFREAGRLAEQLTEAVVLYYSERLDAGTP